MQEQYLLEPLPDDKLDLLSPDEMRIILRGERDLNRQYKNYINELESELFKSQQKSFLLEEQSIQIKHRLFGKSSEKSDKKSSSYKKNKEPRKRVLLPSERYPNLDIIEKRVVPDKAPVCQCCSKEMKDSGLTVTTAAGASNVGKTITAAARTAGSAVISLTCASHGFVAGNKVTVSDVSGGDGVNGVWTVLAVTSANVFTVTGTATTVQALTSLAGVVSGVAGTIKTQSVAAGTASVLSTATITITPWAAAS